jgi:2-dehydro-3-deoxygluconokinase
MNSPPPHTSHELQVVTIGETMMAFEALEPGPLREARLFKRWVGGAENNFAIGLARLGFNCGWISRLGLDEFGHDILRTIRGEGVDTSRVICDPGAPTGVFFVEPHTEGDPHCNYYRRDSAASRLGAEDLDPDYIGHGNILFLTGITPAISPSARQAAEQFFRIGRRQECTLIFDPNLRLKLWDIGEARRVLIPLMQQSHYVLPGAEELKLLMDCSHLDEAIARALDLGIVRLSIKQGGEGALWVTDSSAPAKVPAFKLNNPVSSMGAGDCFAAGFVAGLLTQKSPVECTRWGNAMGAFCLMGSGPYQTLPDFSGLMDFIQGKEAVAR